MQQLVASTAAAIPEDHEQHRSPNDAKKDDKSELDQQSSDVVL
jgi:hypothetical protein